MAKCKQCREKKVNRCAMHDTHPYLPAGEVVIPYVRQKPPSWHMSSDRILLEFCSLYFRCEAGRFPNTQRNFTLSEEQFTCHP